MNKSRDDLSMTGSKLRLLGRQLVEVVGHISARVYGLFGIVAIAVLFWQIAPSPYIYDADLALIAGVGAIGLNLLTGYSGQVSIGNAAFLAIGAYCVVFFHTSLPFPIPVVIGGLAAGLVGLLIGIPSLRLRGLYLIFSTLALQYIVSFAFNQYDTSTGAIAGHFIPSPKIGSITIAGDREWFVLISVLLALVATFVWNVIRGRPGRALAALRANEDAASVMGINVTSLKLATFTASSLIVGLAGAMGAYFLQDVGYSYYSIDLAISYIAMILIGGLASIWGAVVGAIIVTIIPFLLQDISTSVSANGFLQKNEASLDTAIYALAILIFLYFKPAGIASMAQWIKKRYNRNH